jgi:hypothetical protein
MQLLRALMGSPFLQLTPRPHILASRLASLNTSRQFNADINIRVVSAEGFQHAAVNYNFRRRSEKARLLLCMTQN